LLAGLWLSIGLSGLGAKVSNYVFGYLIGVLTGGVIVGFVWYSSGIIDRIVFKEDSE